jgi:plasmid maintenance system antidote protein VapI
MEKSEDNSLLLYMPKHEHPGDLIKAAMKARKVKQTALAATLKMQPTQLSEILSGRRPMTAAFFVGLEAMGLGNADLWAIAHALYQVQQARKEKKQG